VHNPCTKQIRSTKQTIPLIGIQMIPATIRRPDNLGDWRPDDPGEHLLLDKIPAAICCTIMKSPINLWIKQFRSTK
jgi:hypothetical protein